MEILLALGVGIGLSSVAGVRAFVPLALAALFVSFQLDPPNAVLPLVLLVLAALECILDKFVTLERPMNWTMVPIRAAAGAVVFGVVLVEQDPFVYGRFEGRVGSTLSLAEALPRLVPWLIVGAVIAGAVAVLKVVLRPPAKVESSGVSTRFLSAAEDVVALVGMVVGVLIPLVPLFVVGFLLFFYFRIRKRRGRKYGGLRILGD